MLKKIVFILASVFSLLNAEDINAQIAQGISNVSEQSGVPRSVYFTLIDIESNFYPFVICTVIDSAKANDMKILTHRGFEVRISPYKLKNLVSIYSRDEKSIVQLSKELIKQGLSIDMGLMQVNSQNISISEVDRIFDPYYNIARGSNILAGCAEKYNGDIKASIECYNKGFVRKETYDYYEKFIKSYNQNFKAKK